MGINFSHGDIGFSYGGFNELRKEIAKKALQIELDDMQGFGNPGARGEKSWLPYITHPLYDFLNHSDCDGYLTVEQLKKIEPALSEICGQLSEPWKNDGLKRLCAAMREAIAVNEQLEFI